MDKIKFSNPEIEKFSEIWNCVYPLISRFNNIEQSNFDEEKKVIFGLTSRCLRIYESISQLNDLSQLHSSIILTRSLFDTEILINWLLAEESKKRIQLYLEGIDFDKDNLIKKIKSKISTTGQILGDLYKKEIDSYIKKTEKKRSWSGKSIRDLTKDVYLEKSYDIPYWMMSVFTHGSVLSIAHELELNKYTSDKILVNVFDTKSKEGMAWSLVLKYPPISLLHTFRKIDKYLELNQNSEIDEGWKGYQKSLGKLYNNQIQMIEDESLIDGDVMIVGEKDGKPHKKVYQSKDYLRKKNKMKTGQKKA